MEIEGIGIHLLFHKYFNLILIILLILLLVPELKMLEAINILLCPSYLNHIDLLLHLWFVYFS